MIVFLACYLCKHKPEIEQDRRVSHITISMFYTLVGSGVISISNQLYVFLSALVWLSGSRTARLGFQTIECLYQNLAGGRPETGLYKVAMVLVPRPLL